MSLQMGPNHPEMKLPRQCGEEKAEIHQISLSRKADLWLTSSDQEPLYPPMGWEKEWVWWEVLGVALKKVLPMDTTWVKHKCSYLILA